MSTKVFKDRRRFLKQLMMGIGAVAIAPQIDLIKTAKAGGDRRRRHMVQINTFGGCDMAWFQLAITQQSFLDSMSGRSDMIFSNSYDVACAEKAYRMSGHGGDSNGKWHPNYASQRTGGHFLGLGMAKVFSDDDLNRMAIAKGVGGNNEHHVGNSILNHGQNSTYSLSSTALIADGIAKSDYSRALHYVAITDDPSNLHLNYAMNTGYQVPVCISSAAQFQAISSPDPNDLTSTANRRAMLNTAVQSLGGLLAQGLVKKTSQSIANSYSNMFSNAMSLVGGDFYNTVEFRYLFKKIWLAMRDDLQAVFGAGDMPNHFGPHNWAGIINKSYTADYAAMNNAQPLPDISAYLSARNDYFADPKNATKSANYITLKSNLMSTTGALLDIDGAAFNSSSSTGTILNMVYNNAFKFAFAAYLITQDLSAVVDLPGKHGNDPHGDYLGALSESVSTYSGYKMLMRIFKDWILPDGTTLLDCTTIVMHTEMSRSYYIINEEPIPGIAHGTGTSFLLAGYGVKGGKVVGDIHWGPYDESTWGQGQLGTPLPVDLTTGNPDHSGSTLQGEHLLPTLMSIFGFSIPGQQQTSYGAVPALMA